MKNDRFSVRLAISELNSLSYPGVEYSEPRQWNQQYSEGSHNVKHSRVSVQVTTTILEKHPALEKGTSLTCELCLPLCS